MSAEKTHFNIGSRKSKLAMVQTREVMGKLQHLNPSYTFQIHEQETLGDKILDVALSKIGDKGLFTQELEEGLKVGVIDFAVHSLKDLPTQLPEGLEIGCIMERVDPSDVVLMRSDLAAKGILTLQQLNDGKSEVIIGTSSLRRQSQLQMLYPNLKCIDVRGNLDTRIRKLEHWANSTSVSSTSSLSSGTSSTSTTSPSSTTMQPEKPEIVPPKYSAIILAKAGLERQGKEYTDRITQHLTEDQVYYAVGQGALAVECRSNDEKTKHLLSSLHHEPTAQRALAERSFLRTLEGGCHAPIGVCTSLSSEGTLTLKGRVLSLDGSVCIQDSISGPAKNATLLGQQLAQQVLLKGADKILASLSKK